MNETFKITANGRDFQYAVKLLKKRGGVYDPNSQTWSVPAGQMDGCEYVQKVNPVESVDIYRDWSENPNSKY